MTSYNWQNDETFKFIGSPYGMAREEIEQVFNNLITNSPSFALMVQDIRSSGKKVVIEVDPDQGLNGIFSATTHNGEGLDLGYDAKITIPFNAIDGDYFLKGLDKTYFSLERILAHEMHHAHRVATDGFNGPDPAWDQSMEDAEENAATGSENVITNEFLSSLNLPLEDDRDSHFNGYTDDILGTNVAKYTVTARDDVVCDVSDAVGSGQFQQIFNPIFRVYDPLVIDLNGNSEIDLADPNTVYFDVDGDAFAEAVSWVLPTDGFLVRDINENGEIDGIAEMFGNDTMDGFSMLATFDDNEDGVINASDDIWADLLIWQDLNQDGYSQDDELLNLGDFDITGINLASTVTTVDPLITHDGTITTTSGTMRISNILFDADQVNTRYSGEYTLDIATLFLPTLRGYGQMADMHVAASIDTSVDSNGDTLLDKLTALASHDLIELIEDYDTITADMDTLLYHWAGVEGAPAYARGDTVADVRTLLFFEKYMDQTWVDDQGTSDIGLMQMNLFVNAYESLKMRLTGELVFQAGGKALFEPDVHFDISRDTLTGPNDMVLSQDTLDDLSTYALGLSTTAERQEFWRLVTNLLNKMVPAIDGDISGLNEFGLSSAEEAKLDAAITASDALLTWYKEDHGIGGLFSIEHGYNNHMSGLILGGTSGADTLTGSILNDWLQGQGDDDTVNGGDGDDRLEGGAGNDTVYGGNGNDNIEGEDGGVYFNGSNYLYGEAGNDVIRGGAGSDFIYGGDGEDTLWADYNLDIGPSTWGYGGNDFVDGGAGNDFLHGGFGDDTLVDGYGASGQNWLVGGYGEDIYRIIGGGAQVWIANTNNNDPWYEDTIELPDVFVDETELQFERVQNHLHITGTKAGVSVDIYVVEAFQPASGTWLQNLKFQAGLPGEFVLNMETAILPGLVAYGTSLNDTIYSIYSQYHSTIYNDEIHGLAGNDTIYGERGDDTLYGDEGHDSLTGGLGTDQIFGGEGNDYLYEDDDDYNVLDGGAGNDTYYGRANTTFIASDGDDRIASMRGGIIEFQTGETSSSLTYERSNMTDLIIHHGSGSIMVKDYFTYLSVYYSNTYTLRFADTTTLALASVTDQITTYGTSGDDTISGVEYYGWGNANDIIHGGAGNDSISGMYGNNELYGDEGNDTLHGSDGDDLLVGGAGNDSMYGFNGNNSYVVEGNDFVQGGDGYDTIIMPDGITADDIEIYIDLASPYSTRDNFTIRIVPLDYEIVVFHRTHGYAAYRTEKILFSDSTFIDDLTTRNYEMRGTSGDDVIYGFDYTNYGAIGPDLTIFGYEGNDTLHGGSGNDHLDGGTGSNHLWGWGGDDTYYFSEGVATIHESSGTDTIVFSSNWSVEDFTILESSGYTGFTSNTTADSIWLDDNYSSSWIEYAQFGNGLKLYIIDASNWHYGTSGNDTITEGGADKIVIAGAGNDIVQTGAYSDQLVGGAGDDILDAGNGNDVIYGDEGNDTFVYSGGTDVYHGGSGLDVVDFSSFGYAVEVALDNGIYYEAWTRHDADLSSGSWMAIAKISPDVENLTGSHYSDNLSGDAQDNVIHGMGGNDLIHGRDGVDDLWGDTGADIFHFAAVSAYNDVDVVHDFSTTDNDAIDLSDLLTAYDPLTDAIEDFVRLTDNGTDSFLAVDADGGADNFIQIATLKNIIGITDEALLETNGNLLTA